MSDKGNPDYYPLPGRDIPEIEDSRAVEHSIEPENALWADLLSDADLPDELIKEDIY